MFSNSHDSDEKSVFNVNGSPKSFLNLLAPLNSPKESGILPPYYESHHSFMRESNLRMTSERSPSSSSIVTEKDSHGALSKTANVFNDTNSSQSKSLNHNHKMDEPCRFQLSEFIKYNSSMSNSQASLGPTHPVSHFTDPNSKPNSKSEDRVESHIELHSSPNAKSRSFHEHSKLRDYASFNKQNSRLINNAIMLDNSPYLLRSERPRTNSALNALSSVQSSPVNKSQKNGFEIEKAFLTSELEYGNDGMIYQSVYGPVPEALMERMKSAETGVGSTSNGWLDAEKSTSKSTLDVADELERSKENIWIQNETEEHIKEFMLEPKGIEIESKHRKSLPPNGKAKKAAKSTNPKTPKANQKTSKKKGPLKNSNTTNVKRKQLNKKLPKSKPKSTIVEKRKITKPRASYSSDTNPIAESTTHIAAPSPGPALSSDDMRTNKDSDDEYIPGNYRQTRSKRKLTKVTQIDLDVEKKRRLGPRSKSGCWTCRVRHKACPENRPVCSQCQRLQLTCDYSEGRPIYMTDPALQAAKLKDIRNITSQQKKISFARRRSKN